MGALARPAKDTFSPDCVRDSRLQPSDELACAIHAGVRAGLPVWRVPTAYGYLPVPRLAALPIEREGRPVGEVAFAREIAARGGRIALDPDVVALLGGRPLLPERALPQHVFRTISAVTPQAVVARGVRARAESPLPFTRLEAAALCDLAGLSEKQVVDVLERAGEEPTRQARRYIKDGRGLWRAIPGAWPWWVVVGPLPRNWWHDDRVVAAWRAWWDGAA
jgi:hypothetical protein